MSISDLFNQLGSIWYHSEPSDVPYPPNQFLGWDFFCGFLQKDSSKSLVSKYILCFNHWNSFITFAVDVVMKVPEKEIKINNLANVKRINLWPGK